MKSQKINYRISNKQIEKFGDYFKNSINKIFKGHGDDYLSAYVKHHWKDIVGENVAKNVWVAKISDKTLTLWTRHPAWAQEIKHYEEDIISKANAFAGKNLIRFIKFTTYISSKKKNADKVFDDKATLESKIKLNKLTDEESKKLKKSLSKVKDKDLKKVLERYGKLSKQIQNYKRDNLIKCKSCGKFCGMEICNDCKLNKEKELKLKVIKILTDLPYLSFSDVSREIPDISPDMFNKIRLEMLQRQAKKVRLQDGVTFEAKCLTMLYRSLPPEFITDKLVLDTLKTLRYDLASSIFKSDKKNKESKLT